ncbi:hypothetical protein HYQ46_004726 [Verticillium longisporum]|nr:hypothetical protein HYQ46_004726 [Verticillium longisporum]
MPKAPRPTTSWHFPYFCVSETDALGPPFLSPATSSRFSSLNVSTQLETSDRSFSAISCFFPSNMRHISESFSCRRLDLRWWADFSLAFSLPLAGVLRGIGGELFFGLAASSSKLARRGVTEGVDRGVSRWENMRESLSFMDTVGRATGWRRASGGGTAKGDVWEEAATGLRRPVAGGESQGIIGPRWGAKTC